LLAIARKYAENPDRFGVVKVWRPRPASVSTPAIDRTMRFEPNRAAG
jgi:hypothetical protein